jgi:hypothetical protein
LRAKALSRISEVFEGGGQTVYRSQAVHLNQLQVARRTDGAATMFSIASSPIETSSFESSLNLSAGTAVGISCMKKEYSTIKNEQRGPPAGRLFGHGQIGHC